MSYELAKLDTDASILDDRQGCASEKRQCPIKTGGRRTVSNVHPCHIMNGYGGAGTLFGWKIQYNDTVHGGDLHNYVGAG